MAREAASRHLESATELTLLADIKQELIPIQETMSYASRLEILLQTLFELRRRNLEEVVSDGYVEPLERLETLHFVHWAILDQGRRLLLTVDFDGAWEPYLRLIADGAGPILDAILCHCEGYVGSSTDRDDVRYAERAAGGPPQPVRSGFERFAAWAREKQVPTSFFYAAESSLTADDLRYLKQVERLQRRHPAGTTYDLEAAKLHLKRSAGRAGHISMERALRVLAAMHRLAEFFPAEVDGRPHVDHEFLRRLTRELLKGFDTGRVPDLVRGAFAKPLEWFGTPAQLLPSLLPDAVPVSTANLQGDILTPYPAQSHGCVVLLQFDAPGAARNWLERIESRITSERAQGRAEVLMNLGLTFRGLGALGLEAAELAEFPREFREGMEQRATWIGDTGTHHPSRWRRPRANWPVDRSEEGAEIPLGTVDAVVILQTTPAHDAPHAFSSGHPLYSAVAEVEAVGGVSILAVESLYRPRTAAAVPGTAERHPVESREHFGFRDGLSQPRWDPGAPERDRAPLGELLLGHPNARGDDPEATPALLRGGSFLILRKMPQNVGAFRSFLRDQAGLRADGRERPDAPEGAPRLRPAELATRLMGRGPEGEPLLDKPVVGDANDFDFEDDPDGLLCPRHSHVRRANPRTPPLPLTTEATRETPVPRITRRGFPYGPPYDDAPGAERGLFFMAYAASIAEQYEVIQSWINGGNRTGLLSDHRDPLMAPHPISTEPEPRTFRFLYRDDRTAAKGKACVARVSLGVEPFVGLDWGLYLFVPSFAGLRSLRSGVRSAKVGDGDFATETIDRLDRLATTHPEDALREWKKLLEERLRRPEALAVWAAIRARHGGVLDTPYGVLVGSAEPAMAVFRDSDTFSVREYGERMRESLGLHYLGMDPVPRPIACRDRCAQAHDVDDRVHREIPAGRKQRESDLPNALIAGVDEETAFGVAHRTGSAWLAELPDYETGQVRISVRALYEDAFATLSRHWLDLPDGRFMRAGVHRNEPDGPRCPVHYEATARYIFSPNPTVFVSREGRERGRELAAAGLDFVKATRWDQSYEKGRIYARLCASERTDEEIASALQGAVHGFVGPVGGTFLSVAHQWIESGDLWRHQQRLLRALPGIQPSERYGTAREALGSRIIRGMQSAPFPYVLHRTAVTDTRLGEVEIRSGRRVVLGLVSATQEQPGGTEVLFGGLTQDQGGTAHACPGHAMAMGVLLGLLTALLEVHDLRRETALLLNWRRRRS